MLAKTAKTTEKSNNLKYHVIRIYYKYILIFNPYIPLNYSTQVIFPVYIFALVIKTHKTRKRY